MTKGFKEVKEFKPLDIGGNFRQQNEIDLDSPTLSSSSSSSATTRTSDSISTESLYCEEEDIDDISDESYCGHESGNLNINSLQKDIRFFDTLSDLPNISNVSVDTSVYNYSVISSTDSGTFVNPLKVLEQQNESLQDSSGSSEEGIVLQSSQSDLSCVLLSDGRGKEEPRPSSSNTEIEDEQTDDDLFETLLFTLSPHEVNGTAINKLDLEAMAKEREAEELLQQTLTFINDLIYKVVENTVYFNSDLILRQNLDKRKLLLECFRVKQKYDEECKVTKFLNGRMVQFYKRRKLFRSIMQDSAKTLPQEKSKYLKALKRLDEQLAKERNVNESFSVVVARLRKELEMIKQQVQNEILTFETLVTKTLCRDERIQLNAQIQYSLNKMARHRTEVSDVRFQMITKQHSREQLLQKLGHLDDLGNNLTLKDYDHIHNENQTLGKKLEELNVDLEKLRIRLRNNLHIRAHFKEQQSTIKFINANHESILKELLDEYMRMRKYIRQLKLKRVKIRKDTDELNIQAGLLNKPALMYDYDQTVEHLDERRTTVNTLRETLASIRQRINNLEKRLTTDSDNLYLIR